MATTIAVTATGDLLLSLLLFLKLPSMFIYLPVIRHPCRRATGIFRCPAVVPSLQRPSLVRLKVEPYICNRLHAVCFPTIITVHSACYWHSFSRKAGAPTTDDPAYVRLYTHGTAIGVFTRFARICLYFGHSMYPTHT